MLSASSSPSRAPNLFVPTKFWKFETRFMFSFEFYQTSTVFARLTCYPLNRHQGLQSPTHRWLLFLNLPRLTGPLSSVIPLVAITAISITITAVSSFAVAAVATVAIQFNAPGPRSAAAATTPVTAKCETLR